MKYHITLIAALLFFCQSSYGQSDTSLLLKYRTMALVYSHDLKAAEKNISASIELLKSAKDDLKPKLDAGGTYQYCGNPMELTISLPSSDARIYAQGQNQSCSYNLSLSQPIYTGGRILESIRLSNQRHSLQSDTFDLIRSNVCFQTDVQYWNTVASIELASLFKASYQGVAELKRLVEERVNVGMADPQDLLMVEVKLNNSHYQLLKSQNEVTTNCMALNSLIGNNLNEEIDVDTEIDSTISINPTIYMDYPERAEIRIANDKIDMKKSELIISDSQYRPQLSIGAEGGYYSPGYNFKSDLNSNYTLFARLSVPIFNFSKRKSDKKAYEFEVGAAEDDLFRITDEINLEQEQSKINLAQSIQRVELTGNSLVKAEENEAKAIERYNDGKASVDEVIDAQVYKLTTQSYFVEAKLAMQINYSEMLKSLNAY